MVITKKRIRSLEANLPGIEDGKNLVLACPVEGLSAARLTSLGITQATAVGATTLPGVVGPISRYNAEGRFIIHRDQPKETVYRQQEFTRMEWRGQHDPEEVTSIVDIPYQRYPRTFVPPPAVTLTIVEHEAAKLLATTPYTLDLNKPEALLHAINLVLEVSGGTCHVLDQELAPLAVIPTDVVDWELLPQGTMPWTTLKQHLQPVIDSQKPANKPVVEYRWKTINGYGPEQILSGTAGFAGYVAFCFPDKNLYVLESTHYGNATYVFEGDWKEASKLSKAEVLDANLHHARFVHLAGWPLLIDGLLNPPA